MLIFFTNSNLMEFQVGYLVLFPLFSVMDNFGWFWMGSISKSIQLKLEFLRAPFLVQDLSYYTLITFLMLPVILQSIRMMLTSIVSVIRHLIHDNNYSWLLNLNLTYKTLWIGAGSGLLISMLKKLNWFPFYQSNTSDAIDVKMDGSVLGEK